MASDHDPKSHEHGKHHHGVQAADPPQATGGGGGVSAMPNRARIAGVVAWCGFEYLSERNPVEGVKTPGVMDVFRIPKLGATFYQAHGDPIG